MPLELFADTTSHDEIVDWHKHFVQIIEVVGCERRQVVDAVRATWVHSPYAIRIEIREIAFGWLLVFEDIIQVNTHIAGCWLWIPARLKAPEYQVHTGFHGDPE